MTAVPARKTRGRPASRGRASTQTIAVTGAYAAAPTVKNSQTKHTAPAEAACLLNMFQQAWATAATRIRAIAVGLTGRLLRVRPWRACRTEPSRLLSREVLAGLLEAVPGAAR